MKSPDDVLREIEERLRRSWSHVVAGAPWAPEFHLGTSSLTGARLAAAWPDVHRQALAWDDWLRGVAVQARMVQRTVSVHGTRQLVPGTLRVDSIDDAARLSGAEWTQRLARGRRRLATLAAAFPDLEDPGAVLRATDRCSDVDFDLICRTAQWFIAPHPAGLTARQIPVAGLGTKWLGDHEAQVRRLVGVESLGLERGRPPRVHLTYLDPGHRAAGGRHHDVATIGDVDAIAYRPVTVLISENRDTAQLFPPIPGAIAIEGEGRGAGAVAALEWVHEAATIWYWGDMDPDGLEILHAFRAAGLPVRSLFMDLASYERWERFGVDHDHRGSPLGPRTPRAVDRLEPVERDLYLALCSPDWSRHRRIEQERIPLQEAAAVIGS